MISYVDVSNLRSKIICIYGPTSSNKSNFALEIAKKVNGAIINADSMQVYKGLPILTAQPDISVMNDIEHFLYSILPLTSGFSVYEWLKLCVAQIENVKQRGKVPIVVGGTGLYFSSLINGIANIPEIPKPVKEEVELLSKDLDNLQMRNLLKQHDARLAMKLKVNDKFRIIRGLEVKLATGKSILDWQQINKMYFNRGDFFTIYLCPERKKVYQNIELRLLKMIDLGVVNEVKKAVALYNQHALPKIIGLYEMIEYINGLISMQEMKNKISKATKNYAKRQHTWFNNKLNHDMKGEF